MRTRKLEKYIVIPKYFTVIYLSPPQRLLLWEFSKKRKRGKGGKTGKAEKAREKGKSEESLCQISVEIWRPPGGWLCTAMPACGAVEQRIKNGVLKF